MSLTDNLKAKLMSGGIWAFVGKFSTAFMTLGVNALLARLLTPNDLGNYFLAFNIALFGAYIATMGFEQAVLKIIANNIVKNQKSNILYIIRCSFIAGIVGSIVVSAIYFYSSDWISGFVFHSQGLAALSALIIYWIIANTFQVLIGEIFRGFHDIRLASIFGGVLSTALFICGLSGSYFFKWLPLTLDLTIIMWIFSLTASNIVAGLLLKRKLKNLKQAVDIKTKTLNINEILSTSFPLMAIAVSLYILNQCDLWIIGAVEDVEGVAIYGAAAKLTMLVIMPLYILNAFISPLVAESFAKGELQDMEKLLRLISTLAAIPSISLFIIFLFLGKTILAFVFGSPVYSGGALILIILALKQVIIIWNGAASTILTMTGKQKQLMYITIGTGVLSILLSIILGNYFGGVGVAIGFLLAHTISQGFIWGTVFRLFKLRSDVNLTGLFRGIKTQLLKRSGLAS